MKIQNILITIAMATFTVACSTPMATDHQAKPGFANITDIPLPESAEMDLKDSMVMGEGSNWTGHLVYKTDDTPEQVIDFLTTQMQNTGWTKLSELRGKHTLITFLRDQRAATLKVSDDESFINNKTVVSIDMSHSNLKTAVVSAQSAQKEKPQQ